MTHHPRRFFLCLLAVSLLSCGPLSAADPAAGVEQRLARLRKASLAHPEYSLKAVIPGNRSDPIMGELELGFEVLSMEHDLILDFTPGEEAILSLSLNGRTPAWRHINEHIVIAGSELRPGPNRLRCSFRLGDMSLNRREDLLYTLFVPDRARTAFPCFDQPDLKGRFAVELDLPAEWDAVANGPLEDTEPLPGGRKRLRFAPSHPLPTYLMAFAAGALRRIEETREGRRVQIFHQENDPAALDRNVPAIFDQVFFSLEWMERTTGIAYPFDKYDLVLVPSFQYGGMEHCGATLYRASRLILDENATLEETLSRAGLIAHETAHMWFGDLVTMPWFDEVWLKEVFAGFMADKMVEELFPDIDHRMRFLMGHGPPALSVDRTAGTHPITQRLDNLADAGTLYGHLIYHKAPIVMDQLERRVGRETLRIALGRYLRDHAYGNAGWDPLIDALTAGDPGLKDWSRTWVYEAGLPTITVRREGANVRIAQTDASGEGRLWSQKMGVLVRKGEHSRLFEIALEKASHTIALPPELTDPDVILPAGDGVGYGRIFQDMISYAALLDDPVSLTSAVARGAAWMALREGALEGHLRPERLLRTALDWIEAEKNPLLLETLLGDLPALYWGCVPADLRPSLAGEVEARLWEEMLRRPESERMAFFDAFRRLCVSPDSARKLLDLLGRKILIPGLELSEQKELDLLLTLAVIAPQAAAEPLDRRPATWTSSDRVGQLAFLRPLFSDRPEDWLSFFRETLTRPENREREPWALRALSLIHHPLRAEKTRVLIPETLAMLPEIQRTGDIFFPIGWVGESLRGHQSAEAARMVRSFLDRDRTLTPPLRAKVLQGADRLLRLHTPEAMRMRERVEALCSLPRPRNAANPDMLERAARIIENRFEKQGWTVRRREFPYSGGMARNISVLWGREEAPRLVIGAHYDVCGDTPGADDNASGVAVILDLAEKLAGKEAPPDRAVELVAYALEEPPYFGTRQMGSFVHAQSLRKAQKEIPLMISVDMVGYYADERSFLAVIGREEERDILERVSAELAFETMLGVRALPLPAGQRGVDWSDHRNFWIHGYPALMLHSAPLFQNPYYHSPEDRPERLDYPRLSAVSRALLSFIDAWKRQDPRRAGSPVKEPAPLPIPPAPPPKGQDSIGCNGRVEPDGTAETHGFDRCR